MHSIERDQQLIHIDWITQSSSEHSSFLTVSLNFKIILYFEILTIDLTKSHTNLDCLNANRWFDPLTSNPL